MGATEGYGPAHSVWPCGAAYSQRCWWLPRRSVRQGSSSRGAGCQGVDGIGAAELQQR
jgi:hypothetical protein